MLKHQGLSGFAVEQIGNRVKKWTMGPEATIRLRESCTLQVNESMQRRLHPIMTLPVLKTESDENSFSFEMPFVPYDSGFTMSEDLIQNVINNIRTSLKRRVKNEKPNFQIECIEELARIIGEMTETDKQDVCGEILKLKVKISGASRFYPHGYAHGDFGPANMLVNHKGEIYMIDFNKSFIYTPLMDVATLLLGMRSEGRCEWHDELEVLVMSDFEAYRKQIDILMRLKMFSWFPHASEPNWRAQLISMIKEDDLF